VNVKPVFLESSEFGHDIQALIHRQVFPNEITLVADSYHLAKLPVRKAGYLVLQQISLPLCHIILHGQHVEGGGFTCTIRAQNPEHLSLVHPECKVVNGLILGSGVRLMHALSHQIVPDLIHVLIGIDYLLGMSYHVIFLLYGGRCAHTLTTLGHELVHLLSVHVLVEHEESQTLHDHHQTV
jgi:hypothetical protein